MSDRDDLELIRAFAEGRATDVMELRQACGRLAARLNQLEEYYDEASEIITLLAPPGVEDA